MQRCAAHYDAAARVPNEIARRLLDHLDPIRLRPARVLELGSATGFCRSALQARYPSAEVLSMEAAPARLAAGRPPRWRRLLGVGPALICAEPTAVPLPAASVDLVLCNLALSWSPDLSAALGECRRVLRAGGLLLLSTLGPDTLGELRDAWARIDGFDHVLPFPDMHEVGDTVTAARFADTVVDAERLRVEFEDLRHLLHEIANAGPGNPSTRRNPGLTSPRRLRHLEASYPTSGSGPGCWATFEVAYAHAWAPQPSGREVVLPRHAR